MPPFIGFTRSAQIFSWRKYKTDAVIRLVTDRSNFGNASSLNLKGVSFLAFIPLIGLIASIEHRLILLKEGDGGIYEHEVFAGKTQSGFSNDFRSRASFKHVAGLCHDFQGNILVCDQGNSLIRKINADGNVETFVGDCKDETLPQSHRRNTKCISPSRIAALPTGEVFYYDSVKNELALITTEGTVIPLVDFRQVRDVAAWDDTSVVVTTNTEVVLASSSGVAVSVLATATQLRYAPQSSVRDSLGNCLVREAKGSTISRICTDGTIQNWYPSLGDFDATWLSNTSAASSSTSSSSSLPVIDTPKNPLHIACNDSVEEPRMWMIDSNRLFECRSQRSPRRIAGKRQGSAIGLIEFSPTGHLIECSPSALRWMDEYGEFHVFAGSAVESGFCDAPLLAARFHDITSVEFLPTESSHPLSGFIAPMRRPDPTKTSFLYNLVGACSILVTDRSNHAIREIRYTENLNSASETLLEHFGGVVTTFAGSTSSGHRDGHRSQSLFNSPSIVKVHRHTGDILVLEAKSSRLRLITHTTGYVTTLRLPIHEHGHSIDMTFSSFETSFDDPSMLLASDHRLFLLTPSTDPLALNTPLLGPKQGVSQSHCTMVQVSGDSMMYHDGLLDSAYFSGPLRLAYHPLDRSLLVVDTGNVSVRIVKDSKVSTLAGQVKSGREEGSPRQSRLSHPYSVACSPRGPSYIVDGSYELSMVEHIANRPTEIHGIQNLVPRPNVPDLYSDYEIDLSGAKWHLHKIIVRLRCPGLLEEPVVQQINALSKSDTALISSLFYCAYTDCRPTPVRLLTRKKAKSSTIDADRLERLEELFTAHKIGKLARSDKFVRYVENDLADCYRDLFQFKEDVKSILKAISLLGEDSETQLRLFLPFAVRFYQNLPQNVSVTDLLDPLPGMKDPQLLLYHSVRANRFTTPLPALYEYHDSWRLAMRSLLIISDIDALPDASLGLETSDAVICGEKVKLNCHRAILSKCLFFRALFDSGFKESEEAKWQAPQDPSDVSYLNDEVLVAFIDYIYTDSPDKFQALEPEDQLQLSTTISFWYLEDAPFHQEQLRVLSFSEDENDCDL